MHAEIRLPAQYGSMFSQALDIEGVLGVMDQGPELVAYKFCLDDGCRKAWQFPRIGSPHP